MRQARRLQHLVVLVVDVKLFNGQSEISRAGAGVDPRSTLKRQPFCGRVFGPAFLSNPFSRVLFQQGKSRLD